jgi:hypothetical protein
MTLQEYKVAVLLLIHDANLRTVEGSGVNKYISDSVGDPISGYQYYKSTEFKTWEEAYRVLYLI